MIQSIPKPAQSPGTGGLKPATVAIALGAVLLLVVLIGWRVYSAASGPSRPDLPVHPGMYNLRQEIQRGVGARSQVR